jgi:hypothetical protein
VPDPAPFKYRAFLSHSHADTGTAKRVHPEWKQELTRLDQQLAAFKN